MRDKNISILIICILSTILLNSCKFAMTSDIFTSDIFSVSKGEHEYIMVGTKIKLEMTSQDDCQKNAGEIINMLSRYFEEIQNPQCISEGFSDYLQIYVKIPIINYVKGKTPYTPEKGFYYFYVTKNEDKTHLVLILNIDEFNRFNNYIEENYFDNISPEDLTLSFNISNDLSNEVRITGYSVYMNGSPVMSSAYLDLSKRESVNVVLSKIHTECFYNDGTTTAITFENISN